MKTMDRDTQDDPPATQELGKGGNGQEKEETSSTTSEKSSSAGQGYSADASDQSDAPSDETDNKKEAKLAINMSKVDLENRDKAKTTENGSDSGRGDAARFTTRSSKKAAHDTDTMSRNTNSTFSQKSVESAEDKDLETLVDKLQQVTQTAPQFNGIRITDPMDPRIDHTMIERLYGSPFVWQQLRGQPQSVAASAAVSQGMTAAPSMDSKEGVDRRIEQKDYDESMENYAKLFESVRPFFNAHGIAQSSMQEVEVMPASGAQNIEGPSGSSQSEGFTSFFTTTHSSVYNDTSNSNNSNSTSQDRRQSSSPDAKEPATKNPQEEGDASSLAVQARPKRKSRNDSQSGVNGEGASSGSKKGSSSSSNAAPVAAQGSAAAARAPPRVITDIASLNRDSSNANTTSTGTSELNTSSEPNSGLSGSNQGSSGSGNEDKGSSEGVDAENSGEGANGGSSDAASCGIKKLAVHEKHELLEPSQPVRHKRHLEPGHDDVRDRKLNDKRRKRIEMRREYEAQQQVDSSESDNPDVFLQPAKPVTLDRVLNFSKIPRIVLQARPPFLVVHTNAAFSHLTGIQAHDVVGKPVRDFVSVAKTTPKTRSNDIEPRNERRNEEAVEQLDVRRGISAEISLERIIASCGFGRFHFLQVVSKSQSVIGTQVRVVQSTTDGAPGEDSSKTSSLSCDLDRSVQRITCMCSIAPVESSNLDLSSYRRLGMTSSVSSFAGETSKKTSKRQKTTGADEDLVVKPSAIETPKTTRSKSLLTHYVIQLQNYDVVSRKSSTGDSLSSSSMSVEARLLGISKEALQQQRNVLMPIETGRVQQNHDTEMHIEQEAEAEAASDSSNGQVAAIA